MYLICNVFMLQGLGLTQSIDKHLGLRISQARQESAIELAWLAEQIESDTEALIGFESGERRIPALYVARCAKALNKPLKWFFEGLPGQGVFEVPDKSVPIRLVK